MKPVIYVQALNLLLVCGLYSQPRQAAVTTAARAYQSPDGAFSLDIPAGWKARKEGGSNEVSFVLGNVSVSVGAVVSERGETIESWMTATQLLLREECPTAVVQTEGKASVAGADGATFTMFCMGPGVPKTVRESAALLNGKVFTFNVTAPTLQLGLLQKDIDAMAKSFRAGVDLQAAAVETSYQDPGHRFSLTVPAGWTLVPQGENGQEGVELTLEGTRQGTWIRVTPIKGERLEESVASYSRQAQKTYTDLHEAKHGWLDVNGYRALTESFTGVDGQGAVRFAGMTDIGLGKGNSVAIIWFAAQEESALVEAAVEKVQRGIW